MCKLLKAVLRNFNRDIVEDTKSDSQEAAAELDLASEDLRALVGVLEAEMEH